MTALTTWVLTHRRLVAAFWVAVSVLAAVTVPRAIEALSVQFTAPGQEGYEANREIVAAYGNGGNSSPVVPVVTLPEGSTVDSPGMREQLGAAFSRIERALPEARVASYPSTSDRDFVARDGRTTFALVSIDVEQDPFNAGPAAAARVEQALRGVEIGGAEFRVTGLDALRGEEEDNSGVGVLLEAVAAGLAALVVLAVVFGSLLAFVPLVIATVSILVSFLLLWPLAELTDVFAAVQFLIALIGLGVAIDYALLIVTRWREERAAGADNDTAVTRAMARAGRAVVLSGTTVAIGLLAMIALPVPFIRSLGLGGMLIPAVSVLVTITLLPALLSSFGERLEWPRRRAPLGRGGGVWERWANRVVRHRRIAAGTALVLLVALLVPAGSINVGNPRAESLAATGPAHDGLIALTDSGLGAGVLAPFDALVHSGHADEVTDSVREIAAVDGVRGVVAPDAWRHDGRALVTVFPQQDGNSPAGRATLERVRAAAPASVTVGGQAAQSADFVDAVYGNVPLMLGLILILTFALLARAFRSLLLPLQAVLLNLLSVGAAWGVTVLIWQEGYGSELIWGTEATGAITEWVPLMVFAFLYGLSMDYEVFILSRIREEYDLTHDTDAAVVRGLARTGRLVTVAALILFLAFVSLAATPETDLRIFATALAVGIILDATIIRAVLVPAAVSLMGRWNWWLPGRIARGPGEPGMASSMRGAFGDETPGGDGRLDSDADKADGSGGTRRRA